MIDYALLPQEAAAIVMVSELSFGTIHHCWKSFMLALLSDPFGRYRSACLVWLRFHLVDASMHCFQLWLALAQLDGTEAVTKSVKELCVWCVDEAGRDSPTGLQIS